MLKKLLLPLVIAGAWLSSVSVSVVDALPVGGGGGETCAVCKTYRECGPTMSNGSVECYFTYGYFCQGWGMCIVTGGVGG